MSARRCRFRYRLGQVQFVRPETVTSPLAGRGSSRQDASPVGTDAFALSGRWTSSLTGAMVTEVSALSRHSAPIAVVLDANMIWNQWWLDGVHWDGLGELVAAGRIALYVSEVVVREVVRGCIQDAKAVINELEKIKLPRINELLGLGLLKTKKDLRTKVDALEGRYDSELRARLAHLQATVVPLPEVSHEAVPTRAMQGQRPFDPDGRNGYRDVLIWHSLLDIAQHGHAATVFATDNTSDFCTGTPPVLLPSLKGELAAASPTIILSVASKANGIKACVTDLEALLKEERDSETEEELSEIRRPDNK